MSRLIDANLLRAEFTGNFHEMWHYTGIWAMIDCAPTAYDINEKVEQLEELRKEHPYKVIGDYDTYSQYNEAWCDCVDRVIEIVKGGAE